MKRRAKNLEGAFPLLLIGSVLLVYAGVIANQEIAAKGSHLPLWGLMAGVGAVIVGAGIYSTFLEPAVPSGLAATKDWVTVPRAEWNALRAGRREGKEPQPRSRVPIWWEGPPVPSVASPAAVTTEESLRAPRVPHQVAPPSVVRPSSPRRTSLNDLKEALTELETLVNSDVKRASRHKPAADPNAPPACADCGRRLSKVQAPNRCSGCGHQLCGECASSSRLEYTEIRCLECGVRAS